MFIFLEASLQSKLGTVQLKTKTIKHNNKKNNNAKVFITVKTTKSAFIYIYKLYQFQGFAIARGWGWTCLTVLKNNTSKPHGMIGKGIFNYLFRIL